MFQFAPFASRGYGFTPGCRLPGGFPHSDICGSKTVCRLPAAFRRLPRPSSPVIAKASAMRTWSLDPMALPPFADRKALSQAPLSNVLFS